MLTFIYVKTIMKIPKSYSQAVSLRRTDNTEGNDNNRKRLSSNHYTEN